MIRAVFAGVALTALSACASVSPSGPDAGALAALIATARPGAAPQVKAVRCDFIAEEGSEWACRYRERASDGRWVSMTTHVAADGDGWVLIDGVGDPDRPPSR